MTISIFMKNEQKKISVGVIGLWHLGCVYASGLAKLGYKVEGFDPNKNIIENLKEGKAPVFEPELDKVIKENLGKNLFFTNNLKTFFKDKNYIFITYDLPVDEKDRVSTKLIDQTAKLISKFNGQNNVFVVSSQVPLGTCRRLMKTINNNGKTAKIIYFPENIRLGKAFESFLTPDRIILGSDSNELMGQFVNDFQFFKCQFIKMSLESAEMVKHALNSYLATCVSFSSEISDLCEILGANMNDVVGALKTDRRVSPFAPINPGLGFAGATLGRDIQSLKKLGKKNNYKAKLFQAVYQVNQERLKWLIKKIKAVKPELKDVNIGILGLTYKPGTNTLRRSMSLELVNLLKKERCSLRAFDPVVKKPIKGFNFLLITQNYDEFFKDLQIVVLMTEWPEFKEMPILEKSGLMREKIFFDTKNFLNGNMLASNNFIYKGMGY